MSTSWRRHFERLSAQGLWKTLGYYLFTVGLEKIGIHISQSYRHAPPTGDVARSSQATFALVEAVEAWTDQDLMALRTYGGEELLGDFAGAFSRGESCAVARCNEEVACVCWLTRGSEYFLAPAQPSWLIQRCFTLPAHRGKDLYPMTLGFACDCIRQASPCAPLIFIECSLFNAASTRGIRKAGFIPAGRMISILGRKWRWPIASR